MVQPAFSITLPFTTSASDLWVNSESGNDDQDGHSAATALRTIQRAADLAGPGTTIRIQPGIYRESIRPAQSGTAASPIRYRSEGGPGTVKIRGSEPSTELSWTRLAANTIGLPGSVDPAQIYYTDLSAWNLAEAPRFVVELDGQGEVTARLPLASEPDWPVPNEWKHHEFWWAADGGSEVAACNPATDPDPYDCDAPTRSLTQLTDRHNDSTPAGIEAGNLTTLGNLTGARLVVMDTYTGTYVFQRTVTAHDVAAGRITVNEKVEQNYGSNKPALGWGSKYYLENLPRLLDTPGEWWYDTGSQRLYLWPRSPGSPAGQSIEISLREDGLVLKGRSYTTLDGLTVEFFNRNAFYIANTDLTEKSHHDQILNSTLRYAKSGVWLSQYMGAQSAPDAAIDGFRIENSEIAFIDSRAIQIGYSWGSSSSVDSFTRPGVLNTVILHNDLHHLGFRPNDDQGVGIFIAYASSLRFEGNHIHQVAHTGVQINRSIIQSSKSYGFSPSEIKTGEILIRDNLFESACQSHADCGALKITGKAPDHHVFRDLLVTGNIFRDTLGWTHITEQRQYSGGPASQVKGKMGAGMYVDNASGVYAYRNIAYNNAFKGFNFYGNWRDGDLIFYNNIAANALTGFHFGAIDFDTHGHVNTQIVNNMLINNEGNGIYLSAANTSYQNLTIDHNLYFNNGWLTYEQGGLLKAGDLDVVNTSTRAFYPTLPDIQAGTAWEDHGVEGDPNFWAYDSSDHDPLDGSWPDFHLSPASATAVDRGTTALPAGLSALLAHFNVPDPHLGPAYDIGPYEAGFSIQAQPSAAAIEPGGTAHFTLSLYPHNLPFTVALTATRPSPDLLLSLEPDSLSAGTTATLTVTDTHPANQKLPGAAYIIQVSGQGAGYTSTIDIHLMVGGSQVFLPLISRQ